MTCLDLPPFGECFLGGDCTNGTEPDSVASQFCTCIEGWSKPPEINALFFDRKQLEADLGLCNRQDLLLKILYWSNGLHVALILLLQLPKLKRKKQFLRLFPFFCCMLMVLALSVHHLADFDNSGLGNSLVFAILLAQFFMFGEIGAIVFFEKYVHFHIAKMPFAGFPQTKRFQRLRKVNIYFTAWNAVVYQLLWISCLPALLPERQSLTDVSSRTGLLLLRICFGLILLRFFFIWYLVETVLKHFVKDMKAYSRMHNDPLSSFTGRTDRTLGFIQKALVPNSIVLRRTMNVLLPLYGVMFALPAVWEGGVFLVMYFVPVQIFIWALGNYSALKGKSTYYKGNYSTVKQPNESFKSSRKSKREGSMVVGRDNSLSKSHKKSSVAVGSVV